MQEEAAALQHVDMSYDDIIPAPLNGNLVIKQPSESYLRWPGQIVDEPFTKREMFAMAALRGLMVNREDNDKMSAKIAVEYADALIEALKG